MIGYVLTAYITGVVILFMHMGVYEDSLLMALALALLWPVGVVAGMLAIAVDTVEHRIWLSRKYGVLSRLRNKDE